MTIELCDRPDGESLEATAEGGGTVAPSREQVQEAVKEAMGVILGVESPKVDPDGDIPVRAGDVLVFVGVDRDQPIVRVWTTALSDLGAPADIHRVVGEINAASAFARAIWTQGRVVLISEVLGHPLATSQLAVAVEAVATLGQDWAAKLQVRYGGTTRFGRSIPPKACGPGGYL